MSKMMDKPHRDEITQAIAWRIRLRDGGCGDWDEFVAWLESDPGHCRVYDEVALADEDLQADAIPAAPLPSEDGTGEGGQRDGWARRWTLLAASLAAIFLVGVLMLPRLAPTPGGYVVVATGPAERKTIVLAGIGTALLNGSSRLVLDRKRPAYAELVTGEVTFNIRHDPNRRFLVIAGDQRLEDVGTSFNLVRDRGAVSVEVIEGAVRFNATRQAIDLSAGQTLRVRESTGEIALGREPPSAMAGWRNGRLSYSDAPLETVAGDVARTAGVEIRLDPRVAAQPFTGSILIAGDQEATVRQFASVAGLASRRNARGWILEPASRAGR